MEPPKFIILKVVLLRTKMAQVFLGRMVPILFSSMLARRSAPLILKLVGHGLIELPQLLRHVSTSTSLECQKINKHPV
jgi:hypothetical protein